MVRYGSGWAWVLLPAVLLLVISLPSQAQDSPDVEPRSATDGVDGETDAVEAVPEAELPEDIPTRETFSALDEEPKTLGPTPAQYVQVFIGLAVVLLVIWGLSLVLKRFVQVKGLAGSSENLKVLYTLSLTPTRTLYLVRLADRVLLIGAGEGGLRTLAEISDPEEVSLILRDIEFKGNFDLNPFRSRLNSMMGEESVESDEDLDTRQRKLKGILDRLKTPSDE